MHFYDSVITLLWISGEYTGTYKYWEWIKRTDMATRAIQNGNLLINLIHMHTKAPIHHHDHKPTHGLPHTWQIKQYTDSHYIVIYNPQSIHGFTQNPQPIHKSTNPRPHWSWLFTKHQSHIQVHPNKPNSYPSPTAKDNNPSPKPNPKPKHRFTTDHTIPNSPFKVEWEKKIEKWKTERKREESSREGERKVERERERQGSALPSQKPPLMVAVVSGACGAWCQWENNDLGHGGLGPSREIEWD